MSEGAIFMLVACSMFPGLILVAVAVKLWEVHKAKRWPSAEGKVVASGVESHKNKPGDPGYDFSDTEVTNEPRVEYEYQVAGKKYRGKRITIGEKTAGFELEGILARYPVGAAVTVYYDPANPQTAVLERDLPWGIMLAGAGCLLLVFIGGPLLAALVYFDAVAWLTSHLADPERAPFVAAAGGFGLAVLLFALAYVRMMRQASKWPVARGRIVAADAEAYLDWRDMSAAGRRRVHYKPSVLYKYEVHGRQYTGDRVTLGAKLSATSPRLAKRLAARYPVGSEVAVHYNPQSPGESVLHPYSRWHYLLWLIGGGMVTLAWAVATGRM